VTEAADVTEAAVEQPAAESFESEPSESNEPPKEG
jgi:hypothetical protein